MEKINCLNDPSADLHGCSQRMVNVSGVLNHATPSFFLSEAARDDGMEFDGADLGSEGVPVKSLCHFPFGFS